MKTNLNEMADVIHAANKAKGFWDRETVLGEKLMLVTSELSECLEADREGRRANVDGFHARHDYEVKTTGDVDFAANFKENIKDTVEDELADAVIRLMDLSAGLGIDIDWHVKMKLAYNETRGTMHGKKY